MAPTPNRRAFLATSAAIVTASMTELAAQREARPALRIRQNINTLSASSRTIRSYMAGVEAMRKRAAEKKNSWKFWAGLHENGCTHGNWYFLPWHRAYLHHFEEVCRTAANDLQFVLPYWDWTKNPRIPAVLWEAESALNDGSREAAPNESSDPAETGTEVIDSLLASRSFITFAGGVTTKDRPRAKTGVGALEGGPHNYVHRFVGGNMATFLSPLDPVFWLHHANVDRLWGEWERAGGRVANDARFLDGEFTFFHPDETEAKVKVVDLLDTRKLGYRYDTDPERVFATATGMPVQEAAPEALRLSSKFAKAVTAGAPQSASVAATEQFREQVAKFQGMAATEVPPVHMRLTIEGVETPANRDVLVRVFLNRKDADARTSIDVPNYVGAFTFFDHNEVGHQHMEAGGQAYLLDATRAVQRLQATGMYKADDPVKVTLVAVPLNNSKNKAFEVKAVGVKLEVIK